MGSVASTKNKVVLSYVGLVTSMLIFGMTGIWRRNIALSSAAIAAFRGIVGSLLIAVFVKIKEGRVFTGIGKRSTAALMLSGVMLGMNWILLFEAFNFTSVPVATLCNYMQPTLVVLASPFVFREKLTVKKLLCAAVALLGMVFVSGLLGGELAAGGEGQTRGILLGLGSALFYSVEVILNKKVSGGTIFERTAIQLFSAGACLVPYALLTADFSAMALDLRSILNLIAICLLNTGIAYVMYFGSMPNLSATSCAILSYMDPISTMFFSALFLDEIMSFFGIVGAVLIIGSAVVCEVDFKRKKTQRA